MKKYLILVLLVLGGLFSNAQELDEVKKLVILKKYENAKTEIDNYLNNAKNAAKGEGWYYKAFIYNALGRVETKPVADSKTFYLAAFDALKKYAELDPKAPLTVEEKNSTIFNTYYGFYDLGIKTYTNKDYTNSYESFKNALVIHDYIYEKNLVGYEGIRFAAHDTDIVWNLALLANELKKKDEAMFYYKKIADADLGDEKYASAYDDLIIKYKREKNAELFGKYIASAKKHYPIDLPYWENQEVEFALADLEGVALLNKYEELTKTFPNNYVIFYNYAVEIDKYLSGADIKGKELTAYKQKIEDNFKRAITLKSTVEANLQLANLYYSKTYELQEQVAKIKGTKAEEVKLKNELNASVKSTMAATIPYAEEAVKLLAAYTEYKFADKTNYKLALEILSHAYKMANNAAKVAEIEKKRVEVEKL